MHVRTALALYMYSAMMRTRFMRMQSSAVIACRELGYSTGVWHEPAHDVPSASAAKSLPPWLWGMQCVGYEASLADCNMPEFGTTIADYAVSDTCRTDYSPQRLTCADRGVRLPVTIICRGNCIYQRPIGRAVTTSNC